MVRKKQDAPVCADPVAELVAAQRERARHIKFRIMLLNRCRHFVADTLGYHSGMTKEERLKKMEEAEAQMKQIENGLDLPISHQVLSIMAGADVFLGLQKDVEKRMLAVVKQLPIREWVNDPAQKGFGELGLAIVIGECGDLCNYANPAKVWKRLGCAPFVKNGVAKMGATWKSAKEGKLSGEEWETFGYSPRRRSVSFLIGWALKMQNGDGPYRARWADAKAKFAAAHPDYSKGRCDSHGMLLATKLLLKNLWITWTKAPTLTASDW